MFGLQCDPNDVPYTCAGDAGRSNQVSLLKLASFIHSTFLPVDNVLKGGSGNLKRSAGGAAAEQYTPNVPGAVTTQQTTR